MSTESDAPVEPDVGQSADVDAKADPGIIAPESDTSAKTDKKSLAEVANEIFVTTCFGSMGMISGGGLSVFVLMALYQYYFPGDKAAETSTEPPTLELAGRIVSDTLTFVVLAVISVMAVYAIREIVRSEQRPKVKRAKYIATMIGLICVALLFKERFLDQLFIGQDVHSVVKVLLFGGAAAGGWFAWYLKQLKEYGEFFEVFLLTFVSGFAWYARFSPSDEVQWVAVAFVLSPLFRIGKDYIDSDRADAQAVAAKTKSV